MRPKQHLMAQISRCSTGSLFYGHRSGMAAMQSHGEFNRKPNLGCEVSCEPPVHENSQPHSTGSSLLLPRSLALRRQY